MSYSVATYDCTGEIGSVSFSTFQEALEAYQKKMESKPRTIAVQVFNEDLCDVDSDGLTEEERDQL